MDEIEAASSDCFAGGGEERRGSGTTLAGTLEIQLINKSHPQVQQRAYIPVSISSTESFADSANLWANNLTPHPSAPPHSLFTAFSHNWSDDSQDDIFALFINFEEVGLDQIIARQNIVIPKDSSFVLCNDN